MLKCSAAFIKIILWSLKWQKISNHKQYVLGVHFLTKFFFVVLQTCRVSLDILLLGLLLLDILFWHFVIWQFIVNHLVVRHFIERAVFSMYQLIVSLLLPDFLVRSIRLFAGVGNSLFGLVFRANRLFFTKRPNQSKRVNFFQLLFTKVQSPHLKGVNRSFLKSKSLLC